MKLRPVLTASALGGLLAAAHTVPAFADEIETDTSVVETEVTETAVVDTDAAPVDEAPPTTEEPAVTEGPPEQPVESPPEVPEDPVEAEPEAPPVESPPAEIEVEPETSVPDAPVEAAAPPSSDPVDPPVEVSQETEQAPAAVEEPDTETVDEPIVTAPEQAASEGESEESTDPVENEQDEADAEVDETTTTQNSTMASAQNATASDTQQVTVADAQALAEALVGANIEILNVTYTGHELAAGFFSGFESAIGLDSGIVLSTGYVVHQQNEYGDIEYYAVLHGPNTDEATSANLGTPGDDDLDSLVDGLTQDAAVLEIEFIPTHDTIAFNYVFGSEEYLEWVGSTYNDVFAFFVNGQNYATLEDGTLISVNSINHETNVEYFRNNPADNPVYNTGLDGMTVVLGFEAPVNPGVANILKIAIADVSDAVLDSAVMIQAGSFSSPVPNTPPVADDLYVEMDSMDPVVIVLTGSDADGDDLTYRIVDTEHLAGTLTLDGANVIFIPQAGYHGFTTFGYVVNDGLVDSEIAYVLIFVPGDGDIPDPGEPGEQPGEQPEPTDPGGEQPAPGQPGEPGSGEEPREPVIQPVHEVTNDTKTDWVAKTAEEPRALYLHKSDDVPAGEHEHTETSDHVAESGLAATGVTMAPLALGGALLIAVGAGLMFWRRRVN